MVSDTELIDRLREFLRTSDLNTTTTAIVRRKLEEDFGVDLSDRKAFIRQQVDLFLQTEENKEEEEHEEYEEDEKKPAKFKKSEADISVSESESEEEEESGDDAESNNGKRRKKQGPTNKNQDGKKRAGGFNKVSSLSPELQKLVGVPELARTEVVRQLWAYIREKNLQDPNNKKNILCDESLRGLFQVDVIDMFQMNKALSKHIWPLESENAQVTSTPKEKKPKPTLKKKQRKQERHEDSDDPQPKEKRQRGAGSGFLAPLPLSEALAKFIGTGETILPRSAVVKKIWGYIKENNLQDASDRKTILCDDKLKELFNVDSFVGFTVAKLLKDHFIKAEK